METLYYERQDELFHHGVLGMKWGRRRFQTKSGGLTSAGLKRYADGAKSSVASAGKNLSDKYSKTQKGLQSSTNKYKKAVGNGMDKTASYTKKYNKSQKTKANERLSRNEKYGKNAKAMTIAKDVGAGVARNAVIKAIGTATLTGVMAVAATGRPGSAVAMSKVANVALNSASLANKVYTGKNVAYDLMAEK